MLTTTPQINIHTTPYTFARVLTSIRSPSQVMILGPHERNITSVTDYPVWSHYVPSGISFLSPGPMSLDSISDDKLSL